MDLFEFNLRASARITIEEALGKAAISGNDKLANWFPSNCEVVY